MQQKRLLVLINLSCVTGTKQHLLFQFHQAVVGYAFEKQVRQVFVHILFIVMLEVSETARMKQNKDNYNFRITHLVRLVTVLILLVVNHIFSCYKEIICHTINLCNFGLREHSDNRLNVIIWYYKFDTFIAMSLIFKQIFICLYQAHVRLHYFQ